MGTFCIKYKPYSYECNHNRTHASIQDESMMGFQAFSGEGQALRVKKRK